MASSMKINRYPVVKYHDYNQARELIAPLRAWHVVRNKPFLLTSQTFKDLLLYVKLSGEFICRTCVFHDLKKELAIGNVTENLPKEGEASSGWQRLQYHTQVSEGVWPAEAARMNNFIGGFISVEHKSRQPSGNIFVLEIYGESASYATGVNDDKAEFDRSKIYFNILNQVEGAGLRILTGHFDCKRIRLEISAPGLEAIRS